MTTFRDQVMDKLLANLEAALGNQFLTYSRRYRTWEDLIQSIQNGSNVPAFPALYLYDGPGFGGGTDSFAPRGRASPGVVTMKRTIVGYAFIPGGGTPGGIDLTTPGGTVLYQLVEPIETMFATPDSPSQNAYTLGNLVSHAWLSGEGMYLVGDIDPNGFGMFTLPVEIMLYPNSQ